MAEENSTTADDDPLTATRSTIADTVHDTADTIADTVHSTRSATDNDDDSNAAGASKRNGQPHNSDGFAPADRALSVPTIGGTPISAAAAKKPATVAVAAVDQEFFVSREPSTATISDVTVKINGESKITGSPSQPLSSVIDFLSQLAERVKSDAYTDDPAAKITPSEVVRVCQDHLSVLLANMRANAEDLEIGDSRAASQPLHQILKTDHVEEAAGMKYQQQLVEFKKIIEDELTNMAVDNDTVKRDIAATKNDIAATRAMLTELMSVVESWKFMDVEAGGQMSIGRKDHQLLTEIRNQLDEVQKDMNSVYVNLKGEIIEAIKTMISRAGRASLTSLITEAEDGDGKSDGDKSKPEFQWEETLKQGLVEAIAVFFSVLFSCTLALNKDSRTLQRAAISLTGGLIAVAQSYMFGDISGMHSCPMTTLCFATYIDFDWRKVPIFIVGQFSGALLASAILLYSFPHLDSNSNSIGEVNIWWILISEILINMYMMYAKTASYVKKRRELRIFGAVAVGCTVVLGSFVGGSVCGGVMNFAQSLGCAIATKQYKHLWIYFVGSLIGKFLAAGVYRYILLPEAKFLSKVGSFLQAKLFSKVGNFFQKKVFEGWGFLEKEDSSNDPWRSQCIEESFQNTTRLFCFWA